MPIVQIHCLEGRSSEQKKEIIKEVTKAIVKTADVRAEKVRVLLQEVPKDSWGVGGVTKEDLEQ